MRVCLVIASLVCGGAERVATLLTSAWAAQGWEVTILTLLRTGERPFFPLHPRVTLRALDLADYGASRKRSVISAVSMNCRLQRSLRQAIKAVGPQVVLSFCDTTNVRTLLACAGLGLPVVVSERSDPAVYGISRFWNALRRLTYPRAARVVCQSSRALRYFGASLGSRGCVLPNPVAAPEEGVLRHRASDPEVGPWTLGAMGILEPEKGFDYLIPAFAAALPEMGDWRLSIWGEGYLRPALEQQARECGVAERVLLPGCTATPARELARCHAFVLSSRVEGFPNVLCEAMALGLPAVAADVGAVPEILRHGIDGWVVPVADVPALAGALRMLGSNRPLRLEYGRRSREVAERFAATRVIADWSGLLADAVREVETRR